MARLECKDVSMSFLNPQNSETVSALERINFILEKGELLTVLGPLAVKTTLLNLIAGFLTPTNGEIFLGEKKITGPSLERGMVFQQGALFEWLSVEKNVDFGLRMKKGLIEANYRELVKNWLDIVGLKGFEKTPTYQLSGGMQQRVALARCLINDPEVILMDEPLGALDALTREKMQSLILDLWKRTGKTIMIITHSVEEALLLGEDFLYGSPARPNFQGI